MKQSIRRRSFRLFAVTFALLALSGHASAGDAPAKEQLFRDLKIEVIGEGRPLLMIPGLNSSADVWRETCAALQKDKVQCHMVQLPGFAGQPAIGSEHFLDDMRDRLLAYVDERKLKHPMVIGHSLGGFLATSMAVKQPGTFERVVIVDALAFLGAVQNPAATAESVRPMAEGMRKGMLAQDEATYLAATANAVKGMAHDPRRVETLEAWGKASDRATTTQAMFELMTTDLRGSLDQVRAPTLVLGAWAAYAQYGATKESTAAIYKAQYAKLEGVRIELSEGGYHFLMWDDPQWLQAQVRGFLVNDHTAGR